MMDERMTERVLVASLRNKSVRTTPTKFGPREGLFSHSGFTKNEARAKKWKEGGGGGKSRERLPANPSILKNAHWFSRLSSFID